MSGAAFVARPPRHSREEDIEALDEACRRLGGFDPHVSLEWVDGWLAALACAPLRLRSDAWLEAMFGDAFERAFADPPDRAKALAAFELRLDVLRDQLDAETLLDHLGELRLDPVLFEWSDEDRARAVQEHGIDEDFDFLLPDEMRSEKGKPHLGRTKCADGFRRAGTRRRSWRSR